MPWCKEHWSEYQKSHEEGEEWRSQRLGIIRGIKGMREAVSNHFRQWGGRPFMGNEIASIVDSLPGPAVADESAKPQ